MTHQPHATSLCGANVTLALLEMGMCSSMPSRAQSQDICRCNESLCSQCRAACNSHMQQYSAQPLTCIHLGRQQNQHIDKFMLTAMALLSKDKLTLKALRNECYCYIAASTIPSTEDRGSLIAAAAEAWLLPIAMPTSAAARASKSLMPSPQYKHVAPKPRTQ